MTPFNTSIFPSIQNEIRSFQFGTISRERKAILLPLIDFIREKVNKKQEIQLHFICTHNSRRSHLSQVWAQKAAAHFKVKNVFCYSGGTEATSLFPMVTKILEQVGFKIKALSEGKNPVYSIKYAENQHPIIGFSKTYDDSFNPQSSFAAILTCSQADNGCPFISGAEKRIPITFEDPKAFDSRPQQEKKYKERGIQIATDLFYVFSKIKK